LNQEPHKIRLWNGAAYRAPEDEAQASPHIDQAGDRPRVDEPGLAGFAARQISAVFASAG
jgi:hypothetical protein